MRAAPAPADASHDGRSSSATPATPATRAGEGPHVHAAPASGGSGRVTRRFYWGSATFEAQASCLDALADRRLDAGWRMLRALRPHDELRVACATPLADKGQLVALRRARAALAQHGIALDAWPRLTDDETGRARPLNTTTAAAFQASLLPLLDELARTADTADIGLALDVEPLSDLATGLWGVGSARVPIAERARAFGAVVGGVCRAAIDARQGRRDLTELARDLAARAVPVHAAVLPPIGRTSSTGDDTWRTWLLGCPAVDVEGEPLFGTQAALCYAPMMRMLPGAVVPHGASRAQPAPWSMLWSALRSTLRAPEGGVALEDTAAARERERYALALWAARHRAHFDAVVLGPTARGARGDVPIYESAPVLAEDVRAMDALGFADLGVNGLEGLLFGPGGVPPDLVMRSDVDSWLAAAVGEA